MRDIIYKYVGLDAETRKQTVFAVVTAFVDFCTAFHIFEFSDDQVQAIYKMALCIITAIVWSRSHYMNNNYSPEMVVATAKGRDAKTKRMLDQEYVEEPSDSYIEEEEVIADEI